MHGRRDIIRSQMFYSVYTKVTHSKHQRTSTHTNLALSVLVSREHEHRLQKYEHGWDEMQGC